MKHRWNLVGIGGLVLTLLGTGAAALPLDTVKAKPLRKSLESIEQKVAYGRWIEVLRDADRLVKSLFDEGKERQERALAYALVFRALAELALEADHRARWDWGTAQGLLPELGWDDLQEFGELTRRLREMPLSDQGSAQEWLSRAGRLPPPEEITSLPRLVSKAPAPRPARGAKALDGKSVRVSFLIGPEGRTHAPRVLSTKVPSLAIFAALRALAEWRYEPARRGDEPVWMRWETTVTLGGS